MPINALRLPSMTSLLEVDKNDTEEKIGTIVTHQERFLYTYFTGKTLEEMMYI